MKKNKGELCIILGMICSLLFVAPLYVKIFNPGISDEWIHLSIGPGMLACGLIICGQYITKLEDQLVKITKK
jgi:hypothetical protein